MEALEAEVRAGVVNLERRGKGGGEGGGARRGGGEEARDEGEERSRSKLSRRHTAAASSSGHGARIRESMRRTLALLEEEREGKARDAKTEEA